jgi:hypothetical protein
MRASLLPVALVMAVSPLPAQDGSESVTLRTPENAQRFLSAVVSGSGMSVMESGQLNSFVIYKVSAFAAQSRCTSKIDATITDYFLKDQSGQMIIYRGGVIPTDMQEKVVARGMAGMPFQVDWQQVVAITQSPWSFGVDSRPLGNNVLRLSSKDWNVDLLLPTDELATRTKFAMETLKTACAQTEGLGF